MLKELSHGQRERLAYIDYRLQFFGDISRNDLVEQFQMGLASSSRDFATYRELAPRNLVLKHETKRYYRTQTFEPLFEHDAEQVLRLLANAADSSRVSSSPVAVACTQLIKSDDVVLSTIIRSVALRRILSINYASLSSGIQKRQIVPHAFLFSGRRWHVRAFDRRSGEFRDFVCSRVLSTEIIEEEVPVNQQPHSDMAWSTMVMLKLIPHPNHEHPDGIKSDYKMKDGVLEIPVRIAEAKYLLNFWNIDVTQKHKLNPATHHLWLSNSEQLNNDERYREIFALSDIGLKQGSSND